MQRLATVPLVVAAAVVSSTCRGAEPIGPAVPASVAVVSGTIQTGIAGHPLPQPLTVKVTAANGASIPGIAVLWAVRSGGGSLSATTVATDAQGLAAVTFTLGLLAGPQRDTVTATVTGLASALFVVSTAADVATQLVMISGDGQTATVAQAVPESLVVQALDQFSNPVPGAMVQWAAAGGSGSVSPASVATDAAGRSAVQWTLGTSSGPQQASASVSGAGGSPVSFDATAMAGPGAALAFTVEPTSVGAGGPITPPVAVNVVDAFGNAVTSSTAAIDLDLATNPGGATLGGTTQVLAAGGTAVFADLRVNKSGAGYSLQATATGLASATSTAFNVLVDDNTVHLAITVQPGDAQAGAAIPLQVTAMDAFGNTNTSFTGNITVAIANNPAGGTLSGTMTVSASQGIATFMDLRIDQVGSGYTLAATAPGLTPDTSASFDVTAAPSTLLAFVTQPSNATAGVAIAPAIQVVARDSLGNTVTTFTGTVTLAIGTNPGGGTLSGTVTRAATAGVATFDDLSIDKSGVAYVLSATAAPLAGASSAPFTIAAGAVSASQSTVAAAPGSISASSGGTKSTITVTAQDAFGNRIAGASVGLTSTGTGNTLTQPTGSTDGNGTATGSLSATLAESKTVSATIGGVVVTQQATVMVTPAAAAVLAFTSQPTNTAATAAINGGSGGVVVTARDAFGNTASTFTSSVSVAMGANPGSGTLSGTLSHSAVAGVTTFADLSINKAGTGYTLVATSGSLTQATSATFNITGGTAVVSAGNGQSGLKGFPLNIAPAVLVRDATNAPIANAPVTFQVVTGGGSVTGAAAVTDANGIATVGSWTVQLGANSMTATVALAGLTGNPVTFTATGVNAAYHIDVRFLSSMSPSRQAAFTNAASRWESIIYGDVPNIAVNLPAKSCGSNSPKLQETVDDIVIYATVDSIDGPNMILGAAGPCAIRSSGKLPVAGAMLFDSADVAQLEADGQFELVIMHEMGHVLGYGTVWSDLNLLKNAGSANSHFSGSTSIQAFDRSGGQSFAGGSKVPVENCVGFPPEICGSGTQDSHWRELVFGNELMTGFINSGGNPLSVVTTASMGDLGYTVNYAASDAYIVVNPALAEGVRRGSTRHLKDDVLHVPVIEVESP